MADPESRVVIGALMAGPFGGASLVWSLYGGRLGLFVYMWRVADAHA